MAASFHHICYCFFETGWGDGWLVDGCKERDSFALLGFPVAKFLLYSPYFTRMVVARKVLEKSVSGRKRCLRDMIPWVMACVVWCLAMMKTNLPFWSSAVYLGFPGFTTVVFRLTWVDFRFWFEKRKNRYCLGEFIIMVCAYYKEFV